MVHRPSSGPDPLKSASSAAEDYTRPEVTSGPDTTATESDFAGLAARFAAHGGGQVSAALSADLALEIVLNEIVEQACLATGATGAAIVLERDNEMVCRATSGATAPELGARLDVDSGLSGECVRTRRIQRSDDAYVDPRTDIVASKSLGIRSVMVFPLLRDSDLVGVFEIFSTRPFAFGERDERTLEVLALRIFKNLARAAEPVPVPLPVPLPPQPWPGIPSQIYAQSETEIETRDEIKTDEIKAEAQTEPETESDFETQPTFPTILESLEAELPAIDPLPVFSENVVERPMPDRGLDVVTWALSIAVLACTVFLGALLVRHFAWPPAAHTSGTRPAKKGTAPATVNNQQTPAERPASNAASVSKTPPKPAATSAAPAHKFDTAAPAGSLQVFENGKEVFRMPPSQGQAEPASSTENEKPENKKVERASSLEPDRVEVPPAEAEGTLIHRVEPEYPEYARAQKIEGPVVLEVQIGRDGAVEQVKLTNGPPLLAQAATDAVKQWQYSPTYLNREPVEIKTTVDIPFTLNQ